MERQTQDADAAQKLLHFYIDLVENNHSAVKFYLAENVVLDWFGKTIKDVKKVSAFIKEEVSKITHHVNRASPAESVEFRETHHVKVPKNEINVMPISSAAVKISATPTKIQPSTSTKEIGQGDGVHNCELASPPKKIKLESEDENEVIEGESEVKPLKYLTAEGSVEFHKPSIKKLQTETSWKRPVKLHLGYTTSSFKDCTIYLIIYEGSHKCRRNLYKEFCKNEANTKSSV